MRLIIVPVLLFLIGCSSNAPMSLDQPVFAEANGEPTCATSLEEARALLINQSSPAKLLAIWFDDDSSCWVYDISHLSDKGRNVYKVVRTNVFDPLERNGSIVGYKMYKKQKLVHLKVFQDKEE